MWSSMKLFLVNFHSVCTIVFPNRKSHDSGPNRLLKDSRASSLAFLWSKVDLDIYLIVHNIKSKRLELNSKPRICEWVETCWKKKLEIFWIKRRWVFIGHLWIWTARYPYLLWMTIICFLKTHGHTKFIQEIENRFHLLGQQCLVMVVVD